MNFGRFRIPRTVRAFSNVRRYVAVVMDIAHPRQAVQDRWAVCPGGAPTNGPGDERQPRSLTAVFRWAIVSLGLFSRSGAAADQRMKSQRARACPGSDQGVSDTPLGSVRRTPDVLAARFQGRRNLVHSLAVAHQAPVAQRGLVGAGVESKKSASPSDLDLIIHLTNVEGATSAHTAATGWRSSNFRQASLMVPLAPLIHGV